MTISESQNVHGSTACRKRGDLRYGVNIVDDGVININDDGVINVNGDGVVNINGDGVITINGDGVVNINGDNEVWVNGVLVSRNGVILTPNIRTEPETMAKYYSLPKAK